MAKLILKSPYIKNGGKAGGYLEYIGTREGVELLPVIGYLEYMGKRPRSHGLFGDEDHIDLDKAMEEVASCPGNIWTHIISLQREDATRLGYDQAETWKHLLRTHRNEIAEAMHIPPKDFHWYAAFHDEGEHPHVHMMAWSVVLGEVTGKKSYGCLPKKLKNQVDEIVNEMEELPAVSRCYGKWLDLQWQVESYYRDKPRERKPLSEQKEFRSIKNAVIQQAEQIRLGTVTFEDRELKQYEDADLDDRWASDQYWELKNWIEDDTAELEDRDYAISQMEGLARSGDADAQYYLGTLYRDGPLVIPDVKLAADWFYEAAKQNHPAAQYELGKLLLREPEIRDPNLGILWIDEAAKNGSSYAAYRLGKEYLKGQAVERNAEKAVDYFTQAAEGGNQFAQYMLGKLCLMGQGMKQSTQQALVWFQVAADQGHQHAQYFLDRQNDLKPPSVMLAVTRLLYHMSRIFEDTAPVEDGTGMGIHIDRKRLAQLQEKRIALGHKPDDHEEQQRYAGPTMSTPW